LHSFIEPFLTVNSIRKHVDQDSMFPLGTDWFQARMAGLADCRIQDALLWAAERWRQLQADLHEFGGPAWFDRFSTARPAPERTALVSQTAACRELAIESTRPQSAVPAAIRRPHPGPSLLADAIPASPASPPHKHRLVEFCAWSATVGNLAALLLSVILFPNAVEMCRYTLAARPSETDGAASSMNRRSPDGAAKASLTDVPAESLALTSDERRPGAAAEFPENEISPTGKAESKPIALDRLDTARAGDGGSPGIEAPPLTSGTGVPDNSTTQTAPHRNEAGATPSVVAELGRASKPTNSLTVAKPANSLTGSPMERPEPSLRSGKAGKNATAIATQLADNQSARRPSGVRVRDGGPMSAGVPPIEVVDDPEINRLLAEAWELFNRGDYGPGRLRLAEAQKISREDPRAEFSLGLVDAMIDQNWKSAEEHFATCVRFDPDNVPSLNNLAVAKTFNRDVEGAVKQWRSILEQQFATREVVQNLGCVRQLVQQNLIRKKPSLSRQLEKQYADAAVAADTSFDATSGFHLMALITPDGNSVGWADPRKMHGPMLSAGPPPHKPSAAAGPPPAGATPPQPTPPQTTPPQTTPNAGNSVPNDSYGTQKPGPIGLSPLRSPQTTVQSGHGVVSGRGPGVPGRNH
jgi:hypothetical protein